MAGGPERPLPRPSKQLFASLGCSPPVIARCSGVAAPNLQNAFGKPVLRKKAELGGLWMTNDVRESILHPDCEDRERL